MQITKKLLNDFKKDFQEAVKGLEEKYGVTIEMQGATYSSDHFSAPIKVQEKGLEIRNWNEYAPKWGLDINYLHKTFNYKKSNYKVMGVTANPYVKYSIRVLRDDGKEYYFTPDALREVTWL